MENKIFEIMLKNSNIVNLGNEGEMPVINVEQFRDIAQEIVKLFAIPDVVGRSEQLPQVHGLIRCECGEVYDVDTRGNCPKCGN